MQTTKISMTLVFLKFISLNAVFAHSFYNFCERYNNINIVICIHNSDWNKTQIVLIVTDIALYKHVGLTKNKNIDSDNAAQKFYPIFPQPWFLTMKLYYNQN